MKEDIQKLIKKGKRSLESAYELYKLEYYEFAVSRAYYAMFYLAEAALLSKDLVFSRHSGVIAGFGQHFVKTGIFSKELHDWLRTAFDERAIGDYGYDVIITKEEADEVLKNAKEFITHVELHLNKF